MSFPGRVRYRERQRLRAADLQAEQDYLLGVDGRHNLGPHDWGVVNGLQILIDNSVPTILPGAAIDSYGRELIVAERVPLELPADVIAHYVYLFYCERPRGKCGARPNIRWHDSVAIAVSKDPLPMPDDRNASLARVAGSRPDEPFWPVLLGIVTVAPGSPPSVDVSEVRYTRVHAGPVRHSTGRTAMRVGQESLRDPYHFLVTNRSEDGTVENRMAIDRDGNLQFWKDVIVTSTSKSTKIASPIAGIRINSQLKFESVSDVRVQTSTITEGRSKFLQILFEGKTATGQLISETLLIRNSLRNVNALEAQLSEFSENSQLVSLTQTGTKITQPRARAAASTVGRPDTPESAPLPQSLGEDDGPTRHKFGPATIKIEPEAGAGKKEFCGCADADEKAGRLPEGLVFHPGPKPPEIPAKDIYCIRIAQTNLPPVDNLRIAGGPLREGDLNSRIVIGDWHTISALDVFKPWLAFRGNGALQIFGGDPRAPENMLVVKGITELAPVRPDPRDPLFNALSVLAFINGVLSSGVQLLTLTFLEVPAFIETAQPWGYKLTIKNETNEDLTAVPGNSEKITAGQQTFFRVIAGVTPLDPGATTNPPLQVLHTPTDIKLDPATTEVEVEVKIAMSGRVTIAGVKKMKIPVVPSPQIDLSQIPRTVNVTSPPEEFPIRVVNPSRQAVSLIAVAATNATLVGLPAFPRNLPANSSFDARIIIPEVSPPLVTVTIGVTYSRGGGPPLVVTESKEVELV